MDITKDERPVMGTTLSIRCTTNGGYIVKPIAAYDFFESIPSETIGRRRIQDNDWNTLLVRDAIQDMTAPYRTMTNRDRRWKDAKGIYQRATANDRILQAQDKGSDQGKDGGV